MTNKQSFTKRLLLWFSKLTFVRWFRNKMHVQNHKNPNMRIQTSLLVGVDFFNSQFKKEDRFLLIDGLHKSDLICLLALINNSRRTNTNSLAYSKEDIYYVLMCLFSNNEYIVEDWGKRLQGYQIAKDVDSMTLFSRISNLVAIEEILLSDLTDEGTPIRDNNQIENVLYYLCCINDVIVENQMLANKQGLSKMELIVQGMGPSNEFQFYFNPIFDLYRVSQLIDFIQKNSDLAGHLSDFLEKNNLDEQTFFKWAFKFSSQIQTAKSICPPLCIPNTDIDNKHFNYLQKSKFIEGKSILECFNVKKNPVIPYHNGFLILDIAYFADKASYSFINDFFFEQVKSGGINRSKYYGILGNWFEDYIYNLMKSLVPNEHYLATPESLLINTKNGQIELADIYLREKNQIFITQAKVSEINSKDKYSTIDEGVFTLDKKSFFKSFGLYQLVHTSIKYLVEDEYQYESLIPHEKIRVFPNIIVNERFFNNPLVNLVFQAEFRRAIKEAFPNTEIPENEINPINIGRFIICPVIIMHISDLEMLEIHTSKGCYSLWSILALHLNESQLMYPIEATINDNTGQPYNDYLKGPIFEYFKVLADEK